MNIMVKVVRYHLVRPIIYVSWPMVLAFSFAVNLAIYILAPAGGDRDTGGLASIFIMFMVLGLQSIGRWLPFGLTLGMSRRSFYSGTALFGIAFAFTSGLALAGLQAIERATGGWGVAMHFFQVPYLLDGPWYVTWLTSFVGLSVLFVYGMWYGIVHRRWGTPGTIAFIAAQVLVALAGVAALTLSHAWPSVGGFFTALTTLGLTGVLAALTAALLAGGHVTIRRATV